MSRRIAMVLALGEFVGGPKECLGQLIMDAGGPRNIFYGVGKSDNFGKVGGVSASVETSPPAASVGYFKSPGEVLNTDVFGARLKISSPDGLDQFLQFERVPRIDLHGIANWTQESPVLGTYSITTRITGTYADYAFFDATRPAGEQYFKSGFWGAEAHVMLSSIIEPLHGGFGLEVGIRRSSNYEQLQKIDLGTLTGTFPGSGGTTIASFKDAKNARVGELEHFADFPITLIYAQVFDQQCLSDFIKRWTPDFLLDGGERYAYNLILAPYGSFTPATETRPQHSVGINLTLRKFKHGEMIPVNPREPDGPKREDFKSQDISFPVSVFVERKNAFGGKPDTKVGTALIYKF